MKKTWKSAVLPARTLVRIARPAATTLAALVGDGEDDEVRLRHGQRVEDLAAQLARR